MPEAFQGCSPWAQPPAASAASRLNPAGGLLAGLCVPAKQCSVGLRLLENLHPLAGVWEEWGQNKQRPGSAAAWGWAGLGAGGVSAGMLILQGNINYVFLKMLKFGLPVSHPSPSCGHQGASDMGLALSVSLGVLWCAGAGLSGLSAAGGCVPASPAPALGGTVAAAGPSPAPGLAVA